MAVLLGIGLPAQAQQLQWRPPGRSSSKVLATKASWPKLISPHGKRASTLRLLSATKAKALEGSLQFVRPAASESSAPLLVDPVRPLVIQAVQQQVPPLQADQLPPPRQEGSQEPFDPGLLAQGRFQQRCYERSELERPLNEVKLSLDAPPGLLPLECPLFEDQFEGRSWPELVFHWKASALCHKPLYFEEVALERYGHSHGPLVQPFISGAHFFGRIVALPYQMGLRHPAECVYPLGYYRPGSCAPKLLYPLPISFRGALYEGAAATGLVFLLP